MSNQEILTKAIEKALVGGFEYRGFRHFKVYVPDLNWIEFNHGPSSATHSSLEPFTLIFDHDFARALWGEGYKTDEDGTPESPELGWLIDHIWQHHLQQMVIADDPIAYLGEHI